MALSLRAASGGQLAAATPVSQAVTLPAGTATNDIVYFIITIGAVVTAPAAPVGWTLTLTTNATAIESTIVGYRTIQVGDTSPTITWTTAGKVSWTAIALQPAAGTTAVHVGYGTVLNTGVTATSQTPNTYAAGAASGASVLLTGSRGSTNVATAVATTPPTNWTEPTNGDQSTATGVTAGTQQIAAAVSYRLAQTGTITPGTQASAPTAFAIIHHAFAVETTLPVLTRLAATQTSSVATTAVITVPTGGIPLGALIAVTLVAWGENVAASFVASDSKTNSYTKHVNLSTSGIGSVQHWSTVLTAALVAGDTITVTFSPTGMQDYTLTADWGTGYTNVGAQVSGPANGVSTTPTVTLAPSGGATDSLWYGGVGIVDPNTVAVAITEDTDSTGGATWRTLTAATSPTAGRRVQYSGAYKVPVAAPSTTQTYNPTLGTSNLWVTYLVRYPAVVAIDASTPTRVNTTTTASTSASFTPPAGSTLVAVTHANSPGNGSVTAALTNTGTALTWTQQRIANFANGGQSGGTFIHTAPALAQATTVTTTTTNNHATSPYTSLKVYVVTGVTGAVGVGGGASGGSTTNVLTTTGFTTVGASSLGIAGGSDFTGAGSPTSSDMIADPFGAAALSGISGSKTLGAAGSSATFNLDGFGAAASAWTWAAVELVAVAAGVAFDALGPSSAGAGTTGAVDATSATWNHTVGASGTAIVVGVAIGSGLSTMTTTVTCGGVAMTSLGKIGANNVTTGYVQLFGLINPGTGVKAMAVTVTANATISTGSVSFTGAGSFGSAVTAFGNGTAAAVTVVGTSANNMVIDALCTGDNAAAPTTTKTSRWVKATNGNSAGGVGAQATSASAAGNVAMNWTVVSDQWGHIGVEVIASGAAAATALPQPVTNINQTALNRAAYF